MNRALIFGIAIFFAVVGLAMLGADNTAVAGHGCCGCHGGCGGCYGNGHGCHGNSHGCCGYEEPVACGCCGSGGYSNGHAPHDAPAAEAPPAPAAAPAAPAPSAYRRAPAGFRTVSFRR
jgi:hypothetical protein